MDRKKIVKTAWALFEVKGGAKPPDVAKAIWAQQELNNTKERWVVRADVIEGLAPWKIVVPIVGVHKDDEDKAKAAIQKVVAEVKTLNTVGNAEILWVTEHCPEKDKGYKPDESADLEAGDGAERGHNAWG